MKMNTGHLSRREFCKVGTGAALSLLPTVHGPRSPMGSPPEKPVVSVVKIKNDRIDTAVEAAIEWLGGMAHLTQGKQRIVLKPNLTADTPSATTRPAVVQTLARLMQAAGKEVWIGEGSTAAEGITIINVQLTTRCDDVLRRMQQAVFDRLGYSEWARSLGIPLINLHVDELVTVPVPQGFFWHDLVLHRSLLEADLLCSVPVMKTHVYATVTLGLKNLMGLYPGSIYGSYRWWIHREAALKQSPGVAFEILDMVQVNKLGLVVIDASRAMEGDGPIYGNLVPMNLIIAGANPLATDMVGAKIMGFEVSDVPHFVLAHSRGMRPFTLDEIEVRGEKIEAVQRRFARPTLYPIGDSGEIHCAPKPHLALTPDPKAVVTWDEATPKPYLAFTPEGKATVKWTTAIQGPPAILETHGSLAPSGWTPVSPTSPGRYECDPASASQQFFRLRKP